MQAEVKYGSCEAQKDKIMSFIKSENGWEYVLERRDAKYFGVNLDGPVL